MHCCRSWRLLCGIGALISTATLPTYAANNQSRWTSTASQGSLGISTTAPGVAAVLTWGLVPDGTHIGAGFGGEAGPSDLIETLDTWSIGGSGPDLTQREWFTLFQQSYDRLAAVCGLTFVYEPNDDGMVGAVDGVGPVNRGVSRGAGEIGVRPDIRVGGHRVDGNQGILAFNYSPNLGDMVIDTFDVGGPNRYLGSTTNNYRRLRNVFMHETMHGVGLGHVSSNRVALMLGSASSFANVDGPQFDDILGLHRFYGDANEKSNSLAGNETRATATVVSGVPISRRSYNRILWMTE